MNRRIKQFYKNMEISFDCVEEYGSPDSDSFLFYDKVEISNCNEFITYRLYYKTVPTTSPFDYYEESGCRHSYRIGGQIL